MDASGLRMDRNAPRGIAPRPLRPSGRGRPECDPDRDNFALISALVVYVRDALSGEAAERVARRLDSVRGCVEAAKASGMLYPTIDSPLADMIAAVETIAAEKRFAAEAEGFEQKPADLPSVPTPGMLNAGAEAGAVSPSVADSVWRAMSRAFASTAG